MYSGIASLDSLVFDLVCFALKVPNRSPSTGAPPSKTKIKEDGPTPKVLPLTSKKQESLDKDRVDKLKSQIQVAGQHLKAAKKAAPRPKAEIKPKTKPSNAKSEATPDATTSKEEKGDKDGASAAKKAAARVKLSLAKPLPSSAEAKKRPRKNKEKATKTKGSTAKGKKAWLTELIILHIKWFSWILWMDLFETLAAVSKLYNDLVVFTSQTKTLFWPFQARTKAKEASPEATKALKKHGFTCACWILYCYFFMFFDVYLEWRLIWTIPLTRRRHFHRHWFLVKLPMMSLRRKLLVRLRRTRLRSLRRRRWGSFIGRWFMRSKGRSKRPILTWVARKSWNWHVRRVLIARLCFKNWTISKLGSKKTFCFQV